ncbi:MAG: hypothetical protein ACK446_12340, partial [Rhodobacterales bacterium]
MSDRLRPLIGLAAGRALTRAEAETAFECLFAGEATPAQMGGFLMALCVGLGAGFAVSWNDRSTNTLSASRNFYGTL